MGLPKTELSIGSEPILAYLLKRSRWDGPTLLVIAPHTGLPAGAECFDLVAADPVAGQGPLRGVLTALENAGTPIVVIATVDMPGIASTQLHHLCAMLRRRPRCHALMFHQRGTFDAIEPFPSAYRSKQAIALVRAQLQAANLSVRDLARHAGVKVLPAPANWQQSVWTNLNTPSDLKQFLQPESPPDSHAALGGS